MVRTTIVEPVIFICVLAVFCEYTTLQEFVFTRTCLEHVAMNGSAHCDKRANISDQVRTDVSREVSGQMKYYMLIMNSVNILAVLYIGSWSDVFGRKFPMVIPSLFGLIAQFLFALASLDLDIDWRLLIYLAAVLNGLSGGITSIMATCLGYVSDVSAVENRMRRITILEAVFFVGGFVGYQLGGISLTYLFPLKFHYLFIMNAALHSCLILYVRLFLKESRTPVRSDRRILSRMFNYEHLVQLYNTAFKSRTERGLNRKIYMLAACALISTLATNVQTTLNFVYVKKPPLNWVSASYSLYSGLHFLVNGISLITFLPLMLTLRPNLPETICGIIGFASKAIGLMLFGLATTSEMVYATLILYVFSDYTMPSIRSMLSKSVGADEKGKIFALVAVVQNITATIAGYCLYSIFSLSISWFPGLAFELIAAVQLIAIFLLVVIQMMNKEERKESSPELESPGAKHSSPVS
ncbi:Proton-coupled folate transporter [Halotydeus destructor]|nr:Proton-coupled folate transporter [Halotydeus destructor]